MREEKGAAAAAAPPPPLHKLARPPSSDRAASPEGSPRNGYVRGWATPLPQSPPLGFLWLLPAAARRTLLFGLCAVAAAAASVLLWRWLCCCGEPERKAAAAAGSAPSPREAAGLSVVLLLGLCQCLSPLFSLACAFFFLTRYLSRDDPGSFWWFLALPVCCYSGDWVALRWWLLPPQGPAGEPGAPRPPPPPPPAELQRVAGRLLATLSTVAGLTLLHRSLRLRRSLLVLVFSSLVWLVSLTSLGSLAPTLRPLLSGLAGVAGCLAALLSRGRGVFSVPSSRQGGTPHHLQTAPPKLPTGAEEKVPVIRARRRSSCVSLGETSTSYYGSGKMSRRPSLPCISREQFQNAMRGTPDELIGTPVDALVDVWYAAVSRAIDMLAPEQPLHGQPHGAPWFNWDLRVLKLNRRRLESIWRQSQWIIIYLSSRLCQLFTQPRSEF